MLVVADVPLDVRYAHACNVDIPAIDVVPLGYGGHDAAVNGVAVDDFELREPYPLLEARRRADARDHHELDQLLRLEGELAALRLLEAVLGRGDILGGEGLEEDLELVLPKLLLAGLVEEGELAHVVDEDVAQYRQLRVQGRHLAVLGLEGGAEAPQRRRRVELRDLPFDLLGDQLALEVWSPCQYQYGRGLVQ